MDTYGQRLSNVNVFARYNQTTMPSNWLNQLYGIQSQVPTQMVNASLWYNGTTGSDGTITLTMLGAIGYDVYLNSPVNNLNNYYVMLYPSDSMINIYVQPTVGMPVLGNSTYVNLQGSGNTYWMPANGSFIEYIVNYQDITGQTAYVNDSVFCGSNDTYLGWQNFTNPGKSMTTAYFNLTNTRGLPIYWGSNYTRYVT
jgi:hypothetical protein